MDRKLLVLCGALLLAAGCGDDKKTTTQPECDEADTSCNGEEEEERFECSAGTFDDDADDTTPCVDCEPGNFCEGGAAAPVACAAGQQDDDDDPATACAPCDAGGFCAGGVADRVACAAGSWDDDANSATECADCEPGFYCAGETSEPIACDSPLFDADEDPATPCEQGYTVSGFVEGLPVGASLELALEDVDGSALTVEADGVFTLPALLLDGQNFTVSLTPPEGLTCLIASGASGEIAGVNFTGIEVECATSGQLDPSFSVFRENVFGLHDRVFAVAEAPDGSIYFAGGIQNAFEPRNASQWMLARLDNDGAFDETFGEDGYTPQPPAFGGGFEFFPESAECIVLQPNGRIVTAGRVIGEGRDFGLAAFLPNGQLDASFGTDGTTRTNFSAIDDVFDCHEDSQGRIVVVGSSNTDGKDVRVARYSADGILDTTFGDDGSVLVGEDGVDEEARALLILDDDSFVLAGHADQQGMVMRLDAAGALMPSFGNGGTVIFANPTAQQDVIADVELASPDTLVVVGYQHTGARTEGTVHQLLLADGTLNTAFNTTGSIILSELPNQSRLNSVVVNDAGQIFVAGNLQLQMLIMRLSPTGETETGFGQDGLFLYRNPSAGGANHIILDAQGRLLIGGELSANNPDLGVLRVLP